MIKLILKHVIYEICIHVFFRQVHNNFILPKIIHQLRRLKAGWTLEFQEDLTAVHGVDIEQELVDSLTQEIQYEIDQKVLGAVIN